MVLDVRTGKLAWYHQAVPFDVRDYDLTHVAPIFTTTVGGQQRTVIALTGKDGLLRVCLATSAVADYVAAGLSWFAKSPPREAGVPR